MPILIPYIFTTTTYLCHCMNVNFFHQTAEVRSLRCTSASCLPTNGPFSSTRTSLNPDRSRAGRRIRNPEFRRSISTKCSSPRFISFRMKTRKVQADETFYFANDNYYINSNETFLKNIFQKTSQTKSSSRFSRCQMFLNFRMLKVFFR